MAVFTIEGEEVIEKEVGDGGYSGRIYVPKKWIGQLVKIVLISGNGKENTGGNEGVRGRPGGELA